MYKQKLLVVAALTGLVMIVAFRYNHKANKSAFISRQDVFKNKSFIQCSPDWNILDVDSLAASIRILPGWGNYQWNINSVSDSAKLYFQQGINMYYAFHLIEAMASFKKAEQFDDKNAMIYWAQALAYGPNINDFEYSNKPAAFAAAEKAKALSTHGTPKEKALIYAMAVRYAADTSTSRTSLDQAYTDAMEKSFHQFPADADIAALYADAMMLQHPWQYWKHNGQPHPWTNRIIKVLEGAIKNSPVHPGANHYYIHIVEASPNPQRALASAGRLSKLMPSVSHMVHMPSHIYIRSGLYNEGIKVNEMSLQGYKDYLAIYPEVANQAPLYFIHNLHMQTACAMMGADYTYSAKSAEDCQASCGDTSLMSIPAPFGDFVQYVYMTPVLNNVRFGKWQSILDSPAISKNYIYANTLWHWARGFAFARQNNLQEARKELDYMKENMSHPDMLLVLQPFNAPADAGKVAAKLLEGLIAEQANDLTTATTALKEAVKNEDAMIYNEPKDWILPVRPWLGAVLLKSGSYAEAEKIFEEDLKQNPNNHWSLQGLQESLEKQQKTTAAALVKKRLVKTATSDMIGMPIVY